MEMMQPWKKDNSKNSFLASIKMRNDFNTLLKSDVTRRDHHGPLSWIPGMLVHALSIRCQFHLRLHSLRITLKSTTLVCMCSSNA